jgi:hypothetical protein
MSYGFSRGTGDVSKYLDLYRNKEYKETPLLDNFEEISKIIADASYGGNVYKASLLMVYDVCIRKELQSQEHISNHRNGIEVMNYLFDLVNDISGYTEKYY